MPRTHSPERSPLDPVEPLFRALAETVVPELAGVGDEEWRRVTRTIDRVLGRRPRSVQRQLVLLIRAIGWCSLLRRGRRFPALDREARQALLERLESSRWLLLRRGVWGLRTLVFCGHYARPEVHARLGYRAHRDGWEAVAARRGER